MAAENRKLPTDRDLLEPSKWTRTVDSPLPWKFKGGTRVRARSFASMFVLKIAPSAVLRVPARDRTYSP
jgi:hypothetical protein